MHAPAETLCACGRSGRNDARDSYFAALAAIRLRALLVGERWAEEAETFDLVLAAALVAPSAPSPARATP